MCGGLPHADQRAQAGAGELRNAINSQIGTLRACTEKAQGSATITVEVAADGTVSNASANAGQGNGKIAACLIKTVRKWMFPKQPVPKTRFAFPLILC